MNSLIIQKVLNGYLVTGDYEFGNQDKRRLYVYNNIEDLQKQLPELFKTEIKPVVPVDVTCTPSTCK